MNLRIFLASMLAFIAGCEERQEVVDARTASDVAVVTTSRFIWLHTTRPYSIEEYSEKNIVESGIQHRTVTALLEGETRREQFETAAREIYEELRSDIERTQRGASTKRINIRLYDQRTAIPRGTFFLHVMTEPTDVLPDWSDIELIWRNFDIEADGLPALLSEPTKALDSIEFDRVATNSFATRLGTLKGSEEITGAVVFQDASDENTFVVLQVLSNGELLRAAVYSTSTKFDYNKAISVCAHILKNADSEGVPQFIEFMNIPNTRSLLEKGRAYWMGGDGKHLKAFGFTTGNGYRGILLYSKRIDQPKPYPLTLKDLGFEGF